MTNEDLVQRTLANGTPADDTSPIGGATDSTDWIEGTDLLFERVVIDVDGGDANVYYGAAAKAIADGASGTLVDPTITNRCAAILNLNAGVAVIVSTSTLDEGIVRATGKVSGEWEQDDIQASGTTPQSGSMVWDAAGTYMWEYIRDNASAKPVGNITVTVDGQIVTVIYGTGTPAIDDPKNGNHQTNTLHALAVATNKNTVIGWGTNNRRTAPTTNVGSFAAAQKWTGNDGSIALASDLVAEDYHQFVVRLIVPAGIPEPMTGYFHVDVGLLGQTS